MPAHLVRLIAWTVRLCALLFLVQEQALAKEAPTSSVIRVAVSFSIPPWVIQDSDSGIELEILRAAVDGKGYTIKPVYVPFERAFSMFNEGQVDALINARPNSVEGGFYSDIVVYFHNVAISLTHRAFPRRIPISYLQTARVVAFQRARDFLGDEFAEVARSNPNYQEIANQQLQINLLFFRDADFIVMEREIFKFYREQALAAPDLSESDRQKLERLVTIHPLFPPTGYRFVFRQEGLRDTFNEGLARLRENNTFPQLQPPADAIEH